MKNLLIYFVLSLLTALVSMSCNEDFELTTQSCPICTPEEIVEWEDINYNSLGISGIDPVGNYIAMGAAESKYSYRNEYFPVDGFKHTLCGTLKKFNVADDCDWNNHILPDSPFEFILNDVKDLDIYYPNIVHGLPRFNDFGDCEPNPCMEIEIFPDLAFNSNNYFSQNDQSILLNRNLCTYGPWVIDRNHGIKPEIHPSELIWWRDDFENGYARYWMMLLQDNSTKFDDRSDFDFGFLGGSAPSGWRPWSENPRTGVFNIAFELDPSLNRMEFHIAEHEKRYVVTKDDSAARMDSDDGFIHDFIYNGKQLLAVVELNENDNIGVKFNKICRNVDNSRIQGYLKLTSKVGIGDDFDGEGFHVISALKKDQKVPSDEPVIAMFKKEAVGLANHTNNRVLSVKEDEKSLHVKSINEETILFGNLELETGQNVDESNVSKITKVKFVKNEERKSLKFYQNPISSSITVEDIPLVEDGKLEILWDSKVKEIVLIKKPELTTTLNRIEKQYLNPPDQAWKNIITSINGKQLSIPKNFKRINEFILDLNLHYYVSEWSQNYTTTFSDVLNKRVEQNSPNYFLNAEDPFILDWKYNALDVTNEKELPISFGNPTSDGVQLDIERNGSINTKIKVIFPETHSVIVLTLDLKTTDVFGNISTKVVQFSNYELKLDKENGIENMTDNFCDFLTELTGRKILKSSEYNKLITQIKESSLQKNNRDKIWDRIIRHEIIRCVRDEIITYNELKYLVSIINKGVRP